MSRNNSKIVYLVRDYDEATSEEEEEEEKSKGKAGKESREPVTSQVDAKGSVSDLQM